MRIDFHHNFDKSFKKLSLKQQQQFKIRLAEFAADQYHLRLNNHGLKGKYAGYRSFNVTGDLRAIFITHSETHIELVEIGSHSQLYG